jgi:hypothetical protein
MRISKTVRIGALSFAIAVAVACSKEDRREFIAGVGAMAIAEGANEAFSEAGIEVDGEMDCSGETQNDVVSVDCSGMSTDGQSLELQGELVASADDEIVESRTFTGRSDGEEVFSVDCIGEFCDP